MLVVLIFRAWMCINRTLIHMGNPMRTNIEIDDKLMDRAMKAAGTTTKKETVERALEMLIRVEGQKGIRKLRGKIAWEGDIDAWRRD